DGKPARRPHPPGIVFTDRRDGVVAGLGERDAIPAVAVETEQARRRSGPDRAVLVLIEAVDHAVGQTRRLIEGLDAAVVDAGNAGAAAQANPEAAVLRAHEGADGR